MRRREAKQSGPALLSAPTTLLNRLWLDPITRSTKAASSRTHSKTLRDEARAGVMSALLRPATIWLAHPTSRQRLGVSVARHRFHRRLMGTTGVLHGLLIKRPNENHHRARFSPAPIPRYEELTSVAKAAVPARTPTCLRLHLPRRLPLCPTISKQRCSCRCKENRPIARVLGWPPMNRAVPCTQSKLFLEEDGATSPTLTSFQRVYVGYGCWRVATPKELWRSEASSLRRQLHRHWD